MSSVPLFQFPDYQNTQLPNPNGEPPGTHWSFPQSDRPRRKGTDGMFPSIQKERVAILWIKQIPFEVVHRFRAFSISREASATPGQSGPCLPGSTPTYESPTPAPASAHYYGWSASTCQPPTFAAWLKILLAIRADHAKIISYFLRYVLRGLLHGRGRLYHTCFVTTRPGAGSYSLWVTTLSLRASADFSKVAGQRAGSVG
jgi:hypothetical protein